MLLAIDVGNTSTVFGIFQDKKLIQQWRFATVALKFPAFSAKIKKHITQIIISSVVPSVNRKITAYAHKLGVSPFFVSAENIPLLKIKLKNKREIGADRVVNALAVFKLYGAPAIVIDFGTATTFDVISAQGEYLGGAIAPGILMARDALHLKTAKLPRIKLTVPKNVIGNDTVSAMQSGLVYGYAAMVEGMIEKIKGEKRKLKAESREPKAEMKVVATGGLAPLICQYTKVIDTIDVDLTLKGLRLVGAYCNTPVQRGN